MVLLKSSSTSACRLGPGIGGGWTPGLGGMSDFAGGGGREKSILAPGPCMLAASARVEFEGVGDGSIGLDLLIFNLRPEVDVVWWVGGDATDLSRPRKSSVTDGVCYNGRPTLIIRVQSALLFLLDTSISDGLL